MESVTIVIVNYNGERHLRECLASLDALDYPKEKVEVTVFDNGSTDDSLRIVRKARPTVRLIENPRNLGFAAPHRIVAESARGEVLAFLNNDMKVDRQWVKRGLSHLNPSQGIVCSASKILTWDGKEVDFAAGSLQYLGFADQLKGEEVMNGEEILFPCGGAMFIGKDVFLNSGGFDDDYFAVFEDVDLGWRLWVLGYRVVMAQDSVVYHKGHATLDSRGDAKKRFLMHRNALMTIIKNYDEENLKKILPLALVLAVKRTLLFMGVDKRDFYFWENQEPKTSHPDNYQEGCLHLAALDDVFGAFEALAGKRNAVQNSRRRRDEEIFPLFRDPFRNIMGYREYLWEEVSLFGHCHLEELFNCREEYEERLHEGIYHARKALGELTEDLRKTTFQRMLPIEEKEDLRRLASKFYRNVKQEGLTAAIRKTTSYLRRKLV